MSAVAVRIAEKRFAGAERSVLENLELEVTPGELAALVGPSGCGKTTLLNLVAGLDRAFAGSIDAPRERPPGYVFQSPRLLPWLSARDNVALVAGGDRDRADRWLEAVGLAGHEEALPRTLSGGMQRRVALARAFCVEPSLLLLDEPFVSLDQPTADGLRALLLELWAAARPTVLFVTHDLAEAICLADRVVFLSPCPSRVIHEEAIALARPRAREDRAVAALQARLLEAHPELLSGRAGDAGAAPARAERAFGRAAP